MISVLVGKNYLWKEWEKTFQGKESRHCGEETCRACQVCDGEKIVTLHAPENEERRLKDSPPPERSPIDRQKEHPEMNRPQYRYRFRFAKTGRMIYLSHQDLMQLFEAILRRAGIELAFSQGFHPHPKIVHASALSVGVEGLAEYVDITSIVPYEADRLLERIQQFSPPDLHFDAIAVLPQSAKKVTARVHAYRYAVSCSIPESSEDFRSSIECILTPEILQEMNLIDTEILSLGENRYRLNYTCGVDGGKYTKALTIVERLSTCLKCVIEIDKVVRLGLFSLERNGELTPLIAKPNNRKE